MLLPLNAYIAHAGIVSHTVEIELYNYFNCRIDISDIPLNYIGCIPIPCNQLQQNQYYFCIIITENCFPPFRVRYAYFKGRSEILMFIVSFFLFSLDGAAIWRTRYVNRGHMRREGTQTPEVIWEIEEEIGNFPPVA